MPTAQLTLDGRSLSIEDVVRAAREPGLTRAGGHRRTRRAGGEPPAGRGGHRLGADDLRDQHRLRKARQRPHRSRPAGAAAGQSDPEPCGRRGRAACRPPSCAPLMLLRANVLLRPTSGVRPELVDALVAMLNAGVVPVVPEQGSVGASGDLAPLSHVALALDGRRRRAGDRPGPRPRPGARGRRPRARSASRPRKAWPSSTAPRRRPRCSPCWCTMPGCSGGRRRVRRR